MFCTAEEHANASDVEQKFLVPLITAAIPNGLGYGTIDFRTKPNIRRLKLDKGNSEKLNHPDYAIVIAGKRPQYRISRLPLENIAPEKPFKFKHL